MEEKLEKKKEIKKKHVTIEKGKKYKKGRGEKKESKRKGWRRREK